MSFITNPLVYYPISGILWFWHKVFAAVAGLVIDGADSNGVVWALSVVFLVVTLRALLYWPAAKQIRFSKKMQDMQPKMKALQARYKNDRMKLAEEQRKLQKEEGFNPVLGCLPMFIQIPVFLGLFHVLRSFNRMGDSFGALGMTAEETRNTGNYAFSPDEVQSFLDARLFGAPLSSFVAQPVEQFQAFVEPGGALDFQRWQIYVVAIPLMVLAAVVTHFNAKQSISRQTAEAAANPQAAIMNKMMLWVFPLGILATGAFWPLAILVYMAVNNLWTFGQQHVLYKQMAEEDAAAARERRDRLDALAPKVGAKPTKARKGGRPPVTAAGGAKATAGSAVIAAEGSVVTDASESVVPEAVGTQSVGTQPAADEQAGGTGAPAPGAAPRPGQRPAGRTRNHPQGGGKKSGSKGKKRR